MATAITAPMPHSASSTPLSLMSCVRDSSPPLHDPDSSTEQEIDRNEPSKKRRFHPFRGLRKMFRRKVRHSGGEENVPEIPTPESETPNMDSHRSRSTSELLAGDEPTRRKSGSSGLYTGHVLSVSHDSVFTGDPNSGSDLELDTAQSSSLSIQQLVLPGVRAELIDAVRRRRGREDTSEDDEDLGLPRSPCSTAEILDKSVKEHTTKSHSTCSDGSLLSVASSDMDEDSFGLHSRHSSKVSLHEKRSTLSLGHDFDSELDLGDSGPLSAPLSHSAARHKMAIRPKRTHGAPRRRRVQQITTALPTTPEVNEETIRSVTPEVTRQELTKVKLSATSGITNHHGSHVPNETRLKSASLPPGLALTGASALQHVSRSRSNAAASQDNVSFPRSVSHDNELLSEAFTTVGEEDEDEKIVIEKKKEESFFGRLLSRRSGKKKKEKHEEQDVITITSHRQKESIFNAMNIKKRIDEKGRYSSENSSDLITSTGFIKVHKSGPSARQRVEPINIPPSPEPSYKKLESPPHNQILLPSINRSTQEIDKNPPKIQPKNDKKLSSEIHLNIPPKPTIQKEIPKIVSTHPNTFGAALPKIESVQLRSVQLKNSPERNSCSNIPSSQGENFHINPKRMDAYATIIETTSKIVNEEIEKELNKEISSHPRQRKADLLIIEPPQVQENMPTPEIPTKPDFNGGINRMQISYPNSSLSTSQSENYLSSDHKVATEGVSKTPSKSKVVISSYQKKISQFSSESLPTNDKTDNGFMSLNNIDDTPAVVFNTRSVVKSQSFKCKLPPHHHHSNDLTSLPYNVNTINATNQKDDTKYEANIKINSEAVENSKNAIKKSSSLDSIKSENLKPSEPIKSASIDSVRSTRPVTVSADVNGISITQRVSEQDILSPGVVTVSCTPIITKSDNLVTVSISTTSESNENLKNSSISKNYETVSTKPVPFKKSQSQIEKPVSGGTVPEFLKIQLNKVETKPTSNIVLSTSISMIEDSSNTNEIKIRKKSEEIEEKPEKPEKPGNISPPVFIEAIKKDSPKRNSKTDLNSSSENSSENLWKSVNGNTSPVNKKPNLNPSPNPNTTPSSPVVAKPFLTRKSSSLELIETKKETLKKQNSEEGMPDSGKEIDKKINTDENVTLRKKSVPVVKKDEEPELMKVFARRSLKLNTDSELGQQVIVMLDNIEKNHENTPNGKSRDSDKENEADSPREERKKSISVKTIIETKNGKLTNNSEWINQNNLKKDRDVELNTNNMNESNRNSDDIQNEDFIPRFKRIQQRKEEWEQRAQQAMKKTIP